MVQIQIYHHYYNMPWMKPVGDRQMDIFGAKNNDINNIGALWGYGEADELRMAEADMLAGHPEELAEISFDMMGLTLD